MMGLYREQDKSRLGSKPILYGGDEARIFDYDAQRLG